MGVLAYWRQKQISWVTLGASLCLLLAILTIMVTLDVTTDQQTAAILQITGHFVEVYAV